MRMAIIFTDPVTSGGKNECDVDFKLDSKRNSNLIFFVIPVYFIYVQYDLFDELFSMGNLDCVTLFEILFL